jgi:hypothetical protein
MDRVSCIPNQFVELPMQALLMDELASGWIFSLRVDI